MLLIVISTFVCISLGLLGIYWLLYKPQSAATERLRRLGGKDGGATQNVRTMVVPEESQAAELAQRLAQPPFRLPAVGPASPAAGPPGGRRMG